MIVRAYPFKPTKRLTYLSLSIGVTTCEHMLSSTVTRIDFE